jgi:hypothetical protein
MSGCHGNSQFPFFHLEKKKSLGWKIKMLLTWRQAAVHYVWWLSRLEWPLSWWVSRDSWPLRDLFQRHDIHGWNPLASTVMIPRYCLPLKIYSIRLLASSYLLSRCYCYTLMTDTCRMAREKITNRSPPNQPPYWCCKSPQRSWSQ